MGWYFIAGLIIGAAIVIRYHAYNCTKCLKAHKERGK